MDKRNRPALAYLLVGVASAGRAMLAMPDAVALQEVSLTVLALVGYLLLGRRALPVLACGTVQLVLELVLCGTLTGPAWLAPLLRAAALWLLWATVAQMVKIAGYTAKMPKCHWPPPCRWLCTASRTFSPGWQRRHRLRSLCSASPCCGTPSCSYAPTTPPA